MTYLDLLEHKVLLERLVIGLEEPVLVKGLGELSAKIDSGNGGYNVIHGTDFHQQGEELMFTTHDSFGHEKKIQAKVIDTIEVNMGGGNIENRPVIELDIKFAGEDYKKIPFSVSDRSTNTNPILISKGFVEKKLEALIDVGKKNISNDGIDVVYGEGVGNFFRGVGNVAKAPIVGAQKVGGFLSNLGKTLSGEKPVEFFKFKKNLSKKAKLGKQIADSTKIENEDKESIAGKIKNTPIQDTLKKTPDIDKTNTIIDDMWLGSDLPTCLVTSYMMCKGPAADQSVISGLNERREEWNEVIKNAKSEVQEEKDKRKAQDAAKEEQEEGVPEQPTTPDTSTNQQAEVIKPQTPQNGEEQTPQNDQDFEKIETQFNQLNNFTLWFITFEKVINKAQYEEDFKKFIQAGNHDNILQQLFWVGDVTPQSIQKIVNQLAVQFQKDGKQGFFVLCYTPQKQSELKDEMVDIKRETYFFKDLKDMPYQKASKSPQFDAAEAAANPEEIQDDDDADAELLRNFPKPPSKPKDKIVTDEQPTEGDGDVTEDGDTTDTTVDDTTDTADGEVTDEPPADVQTDEAPADDVTDVQSDDTPVDDTPADDGQVEDGAEDGTETGDDEISDETDSEIQPETRLEDPAPIAKDVQPETKLVDKAPEVSERPVDDVRKKEPPVSKEPDLPPFDAVDEPEKEPLPEEKPNTNIQIDQLQDNEVSDDEVSEQVPSEKQSQPRREPRVKTRAQMNAHARQNKKAHMKKGKKKGTESEEEPWWSDYEDEWVRTKMENMRRKGLV